MAVVDKRRFDERVPVNSESFWFTSSIIDISDVGNTSILKAFALQDGAVVVLDALVEVMTAFDGAATLAISQGTIPTPKDVSAVTVVTANKFIIAADVTATTIGIYGQSGSPLATALGVGQVTVLVGADAVTPVVYATLAGAPTVGKARVHLLMNRVPISTGNPY